MREECDAAYSRDLKEKHVSSVVVALASGARGPGFDPRPGEENLVSEHASLHVICRNDMNTVRRPTDQDVNWRPPVQGQSPLCRLKNPTSVI